MTNRLILIGYPVEHSLSPRIHNQAFQKAGLDWRYELCPTKPEILASVMQRFRQDRLTGGNVTIPYKQTVMSYLDGLTERATAMGAVNTLYWEQDRLIGDNTDADGFLSDLLEKQVQVKNCEALILGAGGSARAVEYALKKGGAQTIKTWTRSRGPVPSPEYLTINCTPGLDQGVLKGFSFKPGQLFYDLRYLPSETDMMKKARAEGAVAYNGLGMLEKQAELSFEIWKRLLRS